jgi:hypothetical protein
MLSAWDEQPVTLKVPDALAERLLVQALSVWCCLEPIPPPKSAIRKSRE